MKGLHHIIVQSKGLKYEFDIRRSVTIICGDSATGKTTLVNMIRDFSRDRNRGILIQSDVNCDVFTGTVDVWSDFVHHRSNTIIFVDEDIDFMNTLQFADVIKNSDNYFVLFTRDPLPNIPYSIREIYGIRTSGKYHFPKQIYHEFYPQYDIKKCSDDELKTDILIVEDKETERPEAVIHSTMNSFFLKEF